MRLRHYSHISPKCAYAHIFPHKLSLSPFSLCRFYANMQTGHYSAYFLRIFHPVTVRICLKKLPHKTDMPIYKLYKCGHIWCWHLTVWGHCTCFCYRGHSLTVVVLRTVQLSSSADTSTVTSEVDINDVSVPCRNLLTRGVTQDDVCIMLLHLVSYRAYVLFISYHDCCSHKATWCRKRSRLLHVIVENRSYVQLKHLALDRKACNQASRENLLSIYLKQQRTKWWERVAVVSCWLSALSLALWSNRTLPC